MADVRCPMCGKPNPADAEVCRYCQARLKPITSPLAGSGKTQPPAQTTPPGQPPAGDTSADWLRGLLDTNGSGEPAESSAEPPAEPAGEEPDWLSRIRQRTHDEQDAVSKIGPKPNPDEIQPSTPAASDSDWLNRMTGQEGVSSSNADDVAAWLKSLEENETPQSPVKPAETKAPGAGLGSTPRPSQPAPRDEDEDQWLQSLTARIQASQSMPAIPNAPQSSNVPPTPAAEPEQPAETPDWLRDFGIEETATGGAPKASTEAEQPSAAEPSEIPDWLKSFQSGGEPSAPAPESGAGEELPEWMRGIQGAPAEPAPAQPQAEPASSEELPDWLRDFQDTAGEAPAQPAAVTPAPIEPQAEPAPSEELPDWLRDFKSEPVEAEAQPPAAAPQEPQAEAAAPGELPDWLHDFQSEPLEAEAQPPAAVPEETQAGAAAPGELPDWLRDLQNPPIEAEEEQPPVAAAPQEPQAEAAAPGELPDWLRGFQSSPIQAEEEQPPVAAAPEEPQAEAAELPDWLSGLRTGETEAPVPPAQAPVEPAAEEPTPSWLSSFQEISTGEETGPRTPTAEEAETAQPVSAEETPDWLTELERPLASAEPVESAPAGSADSIQEWLNNLKEPEPAAPASAPAFQGVNPEEIAPAEETPEWLQSVQQQPAGPDVPTVGPASPFDQDLLPEWMKNEPEAAAAWETPSPEPEPSAEAAPPFASKEMSELLAGVSAEETAAPESIEPGQLPNWLQAMRPVEAVVSDVAAGAVDDQRVEKSGPLAGLRGVLPGEELVAQYRKPPVYTNKLQVSEKQHLHASLLDGILAGEGRVLPLPAEPTQAPQVILRLVVAVILIGLILVAAFAPFKLPVPANLASSTSPAANAYVSISTLAPKSNVLLVADFETGLTGEIRMAALPILNHLQTLQPNMAVISSLPEGPVLGEMLLSEAKITPLVDLGYLPGGTTGLKRLSTLPLRQSIPYPYLPAWNKDAWSDKKLQGWNDPALQGLNDIHSFQRIIVLTDSLENARNWVEQVQPTLGGQTQMLIVSSAQVAPLIGTYVENRQVAGAVSGLTGGAAYEQFAHQTGGPGSTSWTAFQLTTAAFILLIVAGVLWAGLASLLGRGKSKRKA